MFAPQSKSRLSGVGRKRIVNDVGLGDANQQQWGGQSTTGGMITQVATMLAPPIQMIPGMSMITSQLQKAGINTNPLSLALASFTGGFSMLPGISNIIGGLFKKATHMESCMNWWTDSNLATMMNGIVPYQIDVTQSFPDASHEYQLEHAEVVTNNAGVKNLLDDSRRNKVMIAGFVSMVRSNPDIMKMQCAAMPQGRAETGVTFTEADIAPIWSQIKEMARQQEYSATVQAIGNILAPYTAIVSAKTAVVQQTRQTGLVTGPGAALLPTGVQAISGGAFVLTPGVSSNLTLAYSTNVGPGKVMTVAPKASIPIRLM